MIIAMGLGVRGDENPALRYGKVRPSSQTSYRAEYLEFAKGCSL